MPIPYTNTGVYVDDISHIDEIRNKNVCSAKNSRAKQRMKELILMNERVRRLGTARALTDMRPTGDSPEPMTKRPNLLLSLSGTRKHETEVKMTCLEI